MSKKFAALLCHLIIRASSKLRHQDSIIVNARIRIFFGKRSLVSEQGREIKALTEANEDNEERLYYPIQLKLEIFVSFVAFCEISATEIRIAKTRGILPGSIRFRDSFGSACASSRRFGKWLLG
jgi:hypothetical protein